MSAREQVMKNASLPPSKRSRIEHQMDRMILLMFALLFSMCMIGSIFFAIWTKTVSPRMWYLAPDQAPTAFSPRQPQLTGVYAFVTSFVLYGYLIPISLYVSLEMGQGRPGMLPVLPPQSPGRLAIGEHSAALLEKALFPMHVSSSARPGLPPWQWQCGCWLKAAGVSVQHACACEP